MRDTKEISRADEHLISPSAPNVSSSAESPTAAGLQIAAIADSADEAAFRAGGAARCSSEREISLVSLISNPVGSD